MSHALSLALLLLGSAVAASGHGIVGSTQFEYFDNGVFANLLYRTVIEMLATQADRRVVVESSRKLRVRLVIAVQRLRIGIRGWTSPRLQTNSTRK